MSCLPCRLVQSFFDDALGGDSGVVVAWTEEGGLAQHAVPADENIFKGQHHAVACVQQTGDIGRWLGNIEIALLFHRAIWSELGLEKPLLLPPRVPSRFDSNRVIAIGHWLAHILFLASRSRVDERFLGFRLCRLFGGFCSCSIRHRSALWRFCGCCSLGRGLGIFLSSCLG